MMWAMNAVGAVGVGGELVVVGAAGVFGDVNVSVCSW